MVDENNVDIVLITESWCNEQISDSMISIPGYNIAMRLDRNDTYNGIGGGLLVYAKDDLTLSFENSEKIDYI